MVDKLLNDERYAEEYARNWTSIWTNILIGRNAGNENNSPISREGMQKYLRDSLARNKPYDAMVKDLVTATGTNTPGMEGFNGAVNFYLDKLEEEGVLRGYTALVDPGRFGWGTHAFVALFCEGRMAAAEVREAVERHPEVEAAYTVAGEASAMLHVRARDTAHLEETLERLRDHPGVTRTQTQIVLSTLFERPFEEPPG
jgi:DNA-binding Lrp family transcriptional regulator